MLKRNTGFSNLTAGYLFPEVARRRREYASKNPNAKIISLGIGNTTEPLPKCIAQAMADYSISLSTAEGYSGYGDEQGLTELRKRIAEVFYKDLASDDEVFISDGAKCDIARIQTLFGSKVKIAVQDPAYPVYVDGSVIVGAAGKNTGSGYKGVTYMPCVPENNFFPDLSKIKKNSLIYFCSPNNPTGAVSSREELKKLVDFAKRHNIVVVNDNPYSLILNENPMSIMQIEGAKDCCIELNSMSKSHNMPGWRVAMIISNPTFISWMFKVQSNIENGTFKGIQLAAAEAYNTNSEEWHRINNIENYQRRRVIAEQIMTELGCKYDSSQVGMFLWGRIPDEYADVEELTEKVLHEARVFITPGFIFGSNGKRYIRISLCAKDEKMQQALERIKALKK